MALILRDVLGVLGCVMSVGFMFVSMEKPVPSET